MQHITPQRGALLVAPFIALFVACASSGEAEPTNSGDGGADPGEGDFDPNFATIESTIFSSCTGGSSGPGHLISCHGDNATVLRLTPGAAYGALVNQPAEADPSLTLVVPGSVEQSFLMRKLTNDLPEDQSLGDPMPKGEAIQWTALPKEQLALIRDWIESGARPAPSNGAGVF